MGWQACSCTHRQGRSCSTHQQHGLLPQPASQLHQLHQWPHQARLPVVAALELVPVALSGGQMQLQQGRWPHLGPKVVGVPQLRVAA